MTNNTADDKGNVEVAPRLLEQVRDRLRVEHYSICTKLAYLAYLASIKRFIRFHGKRHPVAGMAAEGHGRATAAPVIKSFRLEESQASSTTLGTTAGKFLSMPSALGAAGQAIDVIGLWRPIV